MKLSAWIYWPLLYFLICSVMVIYLDRNKNFFSLNCTLNILYFDLLKIDIYHSYFLKYQILSRDLNLVKLINSPAKSKELLKMSTFQKVIIIYYIIKFHIKSVQNCLKNLRLPFFTKNILRNLNQGKMNLGWWIVGWDILEWGSWVGNRGDKIRLFWWIFKFKTIYLRF